MTKLEELKAVLDDHDAYEAGLRKQKENAKTKLEELKADEALAWYATDEDAYETYAAYYAALNARTAYEAELKKTKEKTND